jgi:hypothetical protein
VRQLERVHRSILVRRVGMPRLDGSKRDEQAALKTGDGAGKGADGGKAVGTADDTSATREADVKTHGDTSVSSHAESYPQDKVLPFRPPPTESMSENEPEEETAAAGTPTTDAEDAGSPEREGPEDVKPDRDSDDTVSVAANETDEFQQPATPEEAAISDDDRPEAAAGSAQTIADEVVNEDDVRTPASQDAPPPSGAGKSLADELGGEDEVETPASDDVPPIPSSPAAAAAATASPQAMDVEKPLPPPPTDDQDDHDPSTQDRETAVDTAESSSAVGAPDTMASHATNTASDANEREAEEEPEKLATISHVLTNVVLLQEFILELAAVVQVRSTVFAEVRYA